jgi:hypothetical protein
VPGHGVTSPPVSDGRQVYLLSNGGYFYALALVEAVRNQAESASYSPPSRERF